MIDKNKFQEFISNFLNKEHQTNSFVLTKKREKNYGIDIFSETKKIAVHFRVENFEDGKDVAFNSLMSNIKEILENTKYSNLDFDKFIIISTYKDEPLIFEYTQLLKNENKYPFEIDFWGWDTISKYLKKYEYLLPKNKDNIKVHKFITEIPSIKLSEILGAEANAKKIDFELETNHNAVIHSIIHGIGKSSNALYYAHSKKYKEKYKHIAYVNFVEELKLSFINSFKNSKINYSFNSNYSIFENFTSIIEKLKQIEGKNLLIIDNITNTNEIEMISDFLADLKWNLLITSNSKISNFQNIELEHFNKKQAKEIFYRYASQKNDEDYLNKVLVRINNHPFLTEWFAKKIKSDSSLDIEKLYKILQNKDNKTHHFKDYLNVRTNYENITWQRQIMTYILAVYEHQATKMNRKDKKYLMLLSAMPHKRFTFKELEQVLNLSTHESEEFAETILDFISNGWLQASNEQFYLQPYVKNILHKKLKPSAKKLKNVAKKLTNILYNSSEITDYIPFAESILRNSKRADNNSANLFYNLAQTYEELGVYLQANIHFYDAVQIFENYFYEEEASDKLAETISQIYFKISDFENSLKYSKILLKMREEKYDEESIEIANVYYAMALIYNELEEYEKAIEHIDNVLDIYREYYNEGEEELIKAISLHEYLSFEYEEVARQKNRWHWINKYFA